MLNILQLFRMNLIHFDETSIEIGRQIDRKGLRE